MLASEVAAFDEADTDPQDTVQDAEEDHLSNEEELKCLELSRYILKRNGVLCDSGSRL